MEYLNKEVSDVLAKLQLKSISDKFWMWNKPAQLTDNPNDSFDDRPVPNVPAYCMEDFVGNHIEAKKNCDILLGTGWMAFDNGCWAPCEAPKNPRDKSPFCMRISEKFRMNMVEVKDWKEYILQYITGSI